MSEDMTRDPLARAMFAAWVNVDPTAIPEKFKGHTCPATMAAWKRVGEAAIVYLTTPNTKPAPESGELIERLMASRTVWENLRARPSDIEIEAASHIRSLTTELATVKKRLESAEDALRPFAMALHEWGDDAGQPDRWNVWEHPIANGVTLGDFRSAAHFLQEQEKQNG